MIPLLILAQILVDHGCTDPKKIPLSHLDKARSLRILFGHQSVGGNLLSGLEELASADEKRYSMERSSDPGSDWKGLGEFEVGENENPRGKIDHFARKLSKDGFGKRTDVAMMKLCYVDFGESEEDAPALFRRYRDTMETLERDFGKVRLVWWTAPLADSGNRARHAYNQLIREHCSAKKRILFDIADLECHDPKDRRHVEDGVPRLYSGYTDDGGHLNEIARRRVAGSFWWLLARIAGWDGK